jgi:hypothetical protein
MVDFRQLPISHWTKDELEASILEAVRITGKASKGHIRHALLRRSMVSDGIGRLDGVLRRLVAQGVLVRVSRGIYEVHTTFRHLPMPTHFTYGLH